MVCSASVLELKVPEGVAGPEQVVLVVAKRVLALLPIPQLALGVVQDLWRQVEANFATH